MSSSSSLPLVASLVLSLLVIGSLTFAGMVWQRRRRAAARIGTAPVRTASFACLAAGALLLAVSACFHLFTARVGELRTHDLFVVRARPDMGVPHWDGGRGRRLAAGEVLVRFEHPASAAALRALELEIEAAREGLEVIRARALDIDPKLGRDIARTEAEYRTLDQQRQAARTALGFTETQLRTEILGQRNRLHEAATEIERILGRQARNRSELAYVEAVAASSDDLERQQLMAPLDAQATFRDVETLTAEAAQLARELERQQELQRELTAGLADLQGRLDRNSREVRSELEHLEAELDLLRARRDALDDAARTDLTRLRALRDVELRAQGLEIRALAARLDQQRREQWVVAPADGQVLYVHPSPAAGAAEEPILAFGAAGAVRVGVALDRAEAELLATAGPVPLCALDDFVEPRFMGEFVGARSLQSEPGVSLVELRCAPSSEVLHRLLAGEPRLEVALRWAPPIYRDPLFAVALVLIACHLYLGWRTRWQRRSEARPALEPLSRTPA